MTNTQDIQPMMMSRYPMNEQSDSTPLYTAVVLAGDRGPQDPVAVATGVSCKALSPVAGRPMILRVLAALSESAEVGKIVLSGPVRPSLEQSRPLLDGIDGERWTWLAPAATPSTSAKAALGTVPDQTPVLLTTADHALLRHEIVDFFCVAARREACDLAVAFVTHQQVVSAFPGMRRTASRFRDGAFCGCNLFAFMTPEARKAADFWCRVEHHRKHPWRMIRILGWRPLIGYLTRRLTLAATMRLLGQRLGIRICPVLLPFPEAAVDVDKASDHEAVERILDTL